MSWYTAAAFGSQDASVKPPPDMATDFCSQRICGRGTDQAAAAALRTAGGRVVMINSTAAKNVSADRGAYAASKLALQALAYALQAEEQQNGVRVTSIYTGRVTTDMQRTVRAHEAGPFETDRYLSPESVAHAVFAQCKRPLTRFKPKS
jgi:NAD(P)-dependent dehydrogenase (short-subunit alcohol dehydrogenase family)